MKTRHRLIVLSTALLMYGCAQKPIQIESEASLYLVLKAQNPAPTVFVAHGCDGPRTPSYRDWAYSFWYMGYNAIVVDSFEFRGHKNVCGKGIIVPPSVRAVDFETVALWVKKQEWHKGKIALIGFSHGGGTALNIANNKNVKNIDAVIAYYPGCGIQFGQDFVGVSTRNPKIPAQVHFGGKDDWTPPHLCGDMSNYESYLYPNATHAFDMPYQRRRVAGYWIEHDKEATDLSKLRVQDFLRKNLPID